MPTVNTVVRNKYQVLTYSTQLANIKKFSPCWVTLSKSFQTMEHHSHHDSSANSAVIMESVISGQHSIILRQIERRNLRSSIQTCYSSEFRSNLVQYFSYISKQIRYRVRSSLFSSKISYRIALYDRTDTLGTTFRTNNSNDTRSYPT